MAAFPCNQFGWQEPGEPEAIRAFVSRKLEPFGVDFTVFGKVNVNGPDAHPIWQFLRYNAKETGRGSKILPVPWNFGKFLVDQEGRVVKYFGPGVSTATIEAAVKETLAGTKKGRPPREPTQRPDQAPAHFRPVQFQAAEAAPATE